jgi:hypothetical protein
MMMMMMLMMVMMLLMGMVSQRRVKWDGLPKYKYRAIQIILYWHSSKQISPKRLFKTLYRRILCNQQLNGHIGPE